MGAAILCKGARWAGPQSSVLSPRSSVCEGQVVAVGVAVGVLRLAWLDFDLRSGRCSYLEGSVRVGGNCPRLSVHEEGGFAGAGVGRAGGQVGSEVAGWVAHRLVGDGARVVEGDRRVARARARAGGGQGGGGAHAERLGAEAVVVGLDHEAVGA